jgi:chromate transporter
MAVVTFGGAYAVLAYVAQAAVETHGWLSPGEMVDGLGLAETTPGPLILVLEFVGVLGAMRGETGLPPLFAGALGALVTLWMTFAPCFLWIFAGAPYIERLARVRALSGALAAITAAVVGVILNLSLFFAVHVFFAETPTRQFGALRLLAPDLTTLNVPALVVAVAAAIALLRFNVGLLKVLAAAASAGIVLTLVR